jgi:DNA-directed RNA polymerase subunit beta'
MRTFHVGGAASRAAAASSVSRRSRQRRRSALRVTCATCPTPRARRSSSRATAELVVVDDMGRERERHKLPYGAMLLVDDGAAVKAGHPARLVGSAHPPRSSPSTPATVKLRERGGGRHRRQADRRGDRPVQRWSSSTRSVARRRGSTKGVRPQVKLFDESGEEVKIAGTEHSVAITFQVGSLITVKDGQSDQRRRHPGAYPAGVGEDPRHHRRPAARGRALRSTCAQGCGHACRIHRHGVLRQGDQGQAAPGDHRAGWHARTSS